MMNLSPAAVPDRVEHPVDVVERLASINEWAFDRADDDEISILVAGAWTQYEVTITWLPNIEALHVGCSFDLKVPARRRGEISTLAQMINAQLWIGHFDLWSNENVVMFRHSLVLAGGIQPSDQQCGSIVQAALAACENYYQAFQFVLWAGKSAKEALDLAMVETHGQA
jgi:hypothetical protein